MRFLVVLALLISPLSYADGTASYGGGGSGNGATGVTGQTGASGVNGVNDTTGQTGASGKTGATGASGQTGASGGTGVSGATGQSGSNGSIGATGASGSNGVIQSVGSFSATPSTQGLTLAGSAVNLDPADGTHPGGIALGAQSIDGQKTILGSANAVQLIVKGNSTQTTDILRLQNSAGSTHIWATSGLQLWVDTKFAVDHMSLESQYVGDGYGRGLWYSSNSGGSEAIIAKDDENFGTQAYSKAFWIFDTKTATNTPLMVRGASGQSADLQKWANSSSSTLAKVDSSGQFFELGGAKMEASFHRNCTLTSAAAGTAVHCLVDADVPSGKKAYLSRWKANINGATAWTGVTSCTIQDTNGSPVLFVTIPASDLTGATFIADGSAGLTQGGAYANDTGGTAAKGLDIVCNSNGSTGSDLVVTLDGVVK